MLVLTRRVGERIEIGPDIVVEVVSVAGDRVRVGVVAPRHLAVHREEIAESLRKEGKLGPDGHTARSLARSEEGSTRTS